MGLPAVALLWGLVVADVAAQEQPAREGPAARAGMPEIDTTCDGADVFGGTATERGGWCLVRESRWAAVRALAEQALQVNAESYRAHTLIGLAQHLGEGNLPRAIHHQQQAERLFVEQEGEFPEVNSGPWFVHRLTLLELSSVLGEMNEHAEQIRYIDVVLRRLALDYSPLKAWPLIKLRRFDEARAVAEAAIKRTGDVERDMREDGLTAMCAIESELRRREEAWRACYDAARPHLDEDDGVGGVSLVNAGIAAAETLRFDHAERLLMEATRRQVEGTINPWGHLTHLYLRQGRFVEAVSALREMHIYRRQRPSHLDQQDQADAELMGAALLLVGGRAEDALRITDRVVHRPERLGSSSAAFEQHEAGNFVFDRVTHLEVARMLEEEASWSSWTDAIKLRLRAVKLRWKAWMQTRHAATLLADTEMLTSSLRPDCPGSVEVPAWLDGELVNVVGPGVASAALKRARELETLPDDKAEPFFEAAEAQIRFAQGDDAATLDAATTVVDTMPLTDTLLRARVAAMGASAAMSSGQTRQALALAEKALLSDPGVFRRIGARIPVRLVVGEESGAVRLAVKFLKDSPLFEHVAWGFTLHVGKDEVALSLPDGSALASAQIPEGPSDDESLARRVARTAHRELLAPRMSLTQADIRSLDGGLGAGAQAADHAGSILDEILAGERHPRPD